MKFMALSLAVLLLLLLRKVVLAIVIPVHCKQSSFALCLWALVGEWITISSHSPHFLLPLQEAEDGEWWQHVPVMRQWAGAGDARGEDAFDWCIQFVPVKMVRSVCTSENGAFSLCQWKQISVDVYFLNNFLYYYSAILHSQAHSPRSHVIQNFCLSD